MIVSYATGSGNHGNLMGWPCELCIEHVGKARNRHWTRMWGRSRREASIKLKAGLSFDGGLDAVSREPSQAIRRGVDPGP